MPLKKVFKHWLQKFVDLTRWESQNEEIAHMKETIENQSKTIDEILVRFEKKFCNFWVEILLTFGVRLTNLQFY